MLDMLKCRDFIQDLEEFSWPSLYPNDHFHHGFVRIQFLPFLYYNLWGGPELPSAPVVAVAIQKWRITEKHKFHLSPFSVYI